MSKKLLLFLGVPLGFVLVIVVGFFIAASSQPDKLKVTRSIEINAAPDEVFPLVNDLHQWEKWSPWFKRDPGMNIEYSGAEAGKGARYSWDSEVVGAGTMEIIESEPGSRIKTALKFTEPFEDESTATFEFEWMKDTTKVTWTMDSENDMTMKTMMLFMDFDEMIGKDFDEGLADLKKQAESGATPAPEKEPAPAEEPAPAASDAEPSPAE